MIDTNYLGIDLLTKDGNLANENCLRLPPKLSKLKLSQLSILQKSTSWTSATGKFLHFLDTSSFLHFDYDQQYHHSLHQIGLNHLQLQVQHQFGHYFNMKQTDFVNLIVQLNSTHLILIAINCLYIRLQFVSYRDV